MLIGPGIRLPDCLTLAPRVGVLGERYVDSFREYLAANLDAGKDDSLGDGGIGNSTPSKALV
jgi:hypothetical protein